MVVVITLTVTPTHDQERDDTYPTKTLQLSRRRRSAVGHKGINKESMYRTRKRMVTQQQQKDVKRSVEVLQNDQRQNISSWIQLDQWQKIIIIIKQMTYNL